MLVLIVVFGRILRGFCNLLIIGGGFVGIVVDFLFRKKNLVVFMMVNLRMLVVIKRFWCECFFV